MEVSRAGQEEQAIVPCDLCGSEEQNTVWERGRGGVALRNVVCANCGLVFISPRPPEQAITAQYAEGGFSIEARGGSAPSAKKFATSEAAARRRLRVLKKANVLGRAPNRRMLEIGASVGSLLSLVEQEGWRAEGIEPDAEYAAAGEQAYGVSIRSAFYEEVDYDAGSFGLIASFHVLEHVLSPTAFLEKAHRDLADGGLLFIEVPSVDRPYGGNLDFFFWSPHLTSFGKATLTAFLRKTGFEPLWTGYSGDFLQIIARKTTRRAMELPVRNPAHVRRALHAHAALWRVKKSPVFDPLRTTVRRVRALVAAATDKLD